MRTLYCFIAVIMIVVSGCATAISGRNEAPDVSYKAQGSLTETANCVNGFLTQNNSLEYQFYIRIIQIGQVYESHPGREIMAGGEPVFVRIAATEADAVIVEGYSKRDFDIWFKGLQKACA